MQVAVVAVRVVERAVDLVVDVVPVGDGGVPGGLVVPYRAVERGARRRQLPVHVEGVLVGVGAVLRVKVPVVEIIGVVAMPDLPMPAARSVDVGMVSMLVAGHRVPPSAHRRKAPGRRQRAGAAGLLGLLLATGLLPSTGCARRAPSETANAAAATISPLADLLGRVAGPGWEVRTIVPPGTSAHLFEPAPKDVRRLAGVRLVVTVGGGYDDWAGQLARSVAAGATLLDAGESLGIGLEPGTGHEGHSHPGHGHGGGMGEAEVDPHWWLSPELAARATASMAGALAALDPAGAEGYRARAEATRADLDRLDRELSALLAPFRGRAFLAAHPAWPHFAARYGLRMAGSIEPAPGREPSPRQLRALIDEARAGGFDVLFTEPQFPESAARAIAEDARLRIGLLDPIGGVPGRATYFEMMRFNGAALTTTFGAGAPRAR